MNQKTTKASYLCLFLLLGAVGVRAQFLQHIPGVSNYIRSDVRSELGGLTFTYTIQDSTLAIRTYLIHTNNAGQTLWMKNAGSNYGSHIVTSDSSIIIAGGRSTTACNRIAFLEKIDKNGNVLWIKSIANPSVDVGIGNLMEGSGDTILLTATRSSFSSSTYYSRSAVMAFTGSGTHAWTKSFANGSFTTDYAFSRAMLAANGDFIGVADIRGSSGASANGMMITRIKQNGTIVFSKYFNFLSTHNQLSVTGLSETSTGKIIFGGRLMTDQISTYPNSMWLAQMDDTGSVIMQKSYYGGVDVGELLHGLRSENGKTFAYVHRYAPFDTVQRSFWIGELNEATLSFISQNATELEVTTEDPYGNVRNAFCLTTNGKPTVAGGTFCVATGKNIPMMMQYSSTLTSSCTTLDELQPMIDSTTSYPVTNYTSAATVSLTVATDTTQVRLTDTVSFVLGNLCNGCATSQPPTGVKAVKTGLDVSIFPNPGDGIFIVNLSDAANQLNIAVYNNLGAIVYQQIVSGKQHRIDISNHAPGLYYVQVRMADGTTSVTKLMKDR